MRCHTQQKLWVIGYSRLSIRDYRIWFISLLVIEHVISDFKVNTKLNYPQNHFITFSRVSQLLNLEGIRMTS